MSIKLMSQVWDLDLPPGEKLVLLALADQANDHGTQCYPSVPTVAKRSGQSVRTVRRSIDTLQRKGHLTIEYRDGTSNQYRVHPGHGDRGSVDNTPAMVTGVEAVDPGHGVTPAKLSPRPNATLTPVMVTAKPSRTKREGANAPSQKGTLSQRQIFMAQIAEAEMIKSLLQPVVKSKQEKRATRIPEDFIPGPLPANVAKLVDQWPAGRVEIELDGFRDYWRSRQRNAAMLDWNLTWHNRIRDQHDKVMRSMSNGNYQRPEPRPNRILDALTTLGRYEETDLGAGFEIPTQLSGPAGRA